METEQDLIRNMFAAASDRFAVLRPLQATVLRNAGIFEDDTDLGSPDDEYVAVGIIDVRKRVLTGREAQNVTGTDQTLAYAFSAELDADVTEADLLEEDGDTYSIVAIRVGTFSVEKTIVCSRVS